MSFSQISSIAVRVFNHLLLCAERASQRRILSELDDNLLKDIGLTRHDAFVESVRPFWHGDEVHTAWRGTLPSAKTTGRTSHVQS
jgi:uncharacterized protein YjiS (DUF1127 family)